MTLFLITFPSYPKALKDPHGYSRLDVHKDPRNLLWLPGPRPLHAPVTKNKGHLI